MSTVSVAANGEIAQDIVEQMLDLPVVQRGTIFRTGIEVMRSPNGAPVHLPQLTSIGTAIAHVAEGGTIADASVATDEVVLLPSTVYAIKSMLPITNEARRQAVFNADAVFSNALTRRMADLADASLWNGAGTAGAPTGIFQMTGTTSAGTVAGTALASDNLYAVDEQYVLELGDPDEAVWAMSPANFTRVRKLQDSTGLKILEPRLSQGAPATLLGHPYVVTTNAPDTKVLLMDRSRIKIGQAPSTATILSEFYADTDSTGIRATMRMDIQPLSAANIIELTIS